MVVNALDQPRPSIKSSPPFRLIPGSFRGLRALEYEADERRPNGQVVRTTLYLYEANGVSLFGTILSMMELYHATAGQVDDVRKERDDALARESAAEGRCNSLRRQLEGHQRQKKGNGA
jgi:hypothetical protein